MSASEENRCNEKQLRGGVAVSSVHYEQQITDLTVEVARLNEALVIAAGEVEGLEGKYAALMDALMTILICDVCFVDKCKAQEGGEKDCKIDVDRHVSQKVKGE